MKASLSSTVADSTPPIPDNENVNAFQHNGYLTSQQVSLLRAYWNTPVYSSSC